jgi:DNA polymerase-1
MVALERRLAAEKGGARMVLTIHDELLFEVPPAAAAKAGAVIREEMAGVVALKVPLEVHVGTGANWLDAHG